MYDLNILNDFRIDLEKDLSQEEHHKLLLVLFSYGIYWVSDIKDELCDLMPFVYIRDKEIYHSNWLYTPWDNFLVLKYEDIVNGN